MRKGRGREWTECPAPGFPKKKKSDEKRKSTENGRQKPTGKHEGGGPTPTKKKEGKRKIATQLRNRRIMTRVEETVETETYRAYKHRGGLEMAGSSKAKRGGGNINLPRSSKKRRKEKTTK